MHFGKIRGSRQTFILVAKINSSVEDLVLLVQLEVDLYIYNTNLAYETLLEQSGKLAKASREHGGSVGLVSHSAMHSSETHNQNIMTI